MYQPGVVAAGPPGTRFAAVHRFAEIGSTNRWLLDRAKEGVPEGTVAVAGYQRAGRGRLGRRWEAPPGANLLVSVLLRPALDPDELHLCTVAVALAAADACTVAAGVTPGLKWPNDLEVGERKLAGILAESIPGAESLPRTESAVVVGLGLNVGWPSAPDLDDVDEDLRHSATSLLLAAGAAPAVDAVLEALLVALEPWLVALAERDGRRRMAGEYRRRCTTLGRTVRVSGHDETFTGVATDVTLAGHLVIDVGACMRTVAAGDVVHLRAGG